MDKTNREDSPSSTGASIGVGTSDLDDDTADVVPDPTNGAANEVIINAGFPVRDPAGSEPEIPPVDEVLEPGYILRDRYEIVELVHSGGMGHVYKALDNRRRRSASGQVHVAIKMMRRSLTPEIDGRLALEREAARTQQLSHPNIVNIYDFDQHGDQFFIVMEWLDGESFNAMLRRRNGRSITTPFAWRIIEGVANGLEHAHSNGVVHADINPSNIFITVTQDVKILDFGVARFVSAPGDEDDPSIGWVTRSYASPEVLDGSPPGFQDDIFSLGCIVYRALTGRHPFGGKTSAEARHAHLVLRPIPRLADKYWQVLKNALSYKRDHRPESASAFFVDRQDTGKLESPLRSTKKFWAPAILLASSGLLAGLWWLFQPDAGDALPVQDEPVAVETAVAIDAEPIVEPSPLDIVLSNAAQAMEALRFLEPVDDNAHDFYREALLLDPANSIALAGLRTISNDYVQQAEFALQSDDVEGVVAALGIAGEIDPGNPALVTVNNLLVAQANEALANARLAISQGDTKRASQFLYLAERFSQGNETSIDEVRGGILEAEQDGELLEAIASANASITAGRLIKPPADNAHEQLLELQRDYGVDPSVNTSIERLIERLLYRAAFATAGGQFSVAKEDIDAAAMFGVRESDVASARTWLQQAIDLAAVPIPDETALAGSIENEPSKVGDSTTENAVADEEISDLASGPAPVAENLQLVQFSQLEIENYVAPRYPPRASESELSGAVDLRFNVNPDGSTGNIEIVRAVPPDTFGPSATDAVRQWLFAERDEVIRTQVRLRFDP